MRLGEIPGFDALTYEQQHAVATRGRRVNLSEGAPLIIANLPVDIMWVLVDGQLVDVDTAGYPCAVLRSPSVISGRLGTRWPTSLYCRTPATLLAVPLYAVDEPVHAMSSTLREPPGQLEAMAPWRHDIQLTIAWLQELAPTNLIEVGTGRGFYSRFLMGVCDRITVTDPRPDILTAAAAMVRWYAPAGAVVRSVACGGETLACQDSAYDAIVTRMALHHMTSVPKFLDEASRVITPEGVLVAIDLLGPSDRSIASQLDERERRLDPSHRCVLDEGRLQALLARAGFHLERFETTRVRTSLLDLAGRLGCSPRLIAETSSWLQQLSTRVRETLGVEGAASDGDVVWTDERFAILATRAC